MGNQPDNFLSFAKVSFFWRDFFHIFMCKTNMKLECLYFIESALKMLISKKLSFLDVSVKKKSFINQLYIKLGCQLAKSQSITTCHWIKKGTFREPESNFFLKNSIACKNSVKMSSTRKNSFNDKKSTYLSQFIIF